MEKIKCAAIKYRLLCDYTSPNYSGDHIIIGKSHAECIYTFGSIGLSCKLRDMDNEVQGFMTTNDRFVDRKEALEIAKNAKQVPDDYSKNELFSEDIIEEEFV